MFRLSSCVCLCWISVSLFQYGHEAFPSNTSIDHQPSNVTVIQDEEATGWDSPFLQLRASLPSFSQPIRPYSLLTNTEDYHYLPKPRHRRPSRLLRLLGSSFDPFWMSIEQPSEASEDHSKARSFLHDGDTLPIKLLSSSPELREAAADHHQKLMKEAAGLDLRSLPSDVTSSVQSWLVSFATCKLYYRWMDLGPAFWPRWLRHTDCKRSDEVQSCSFPSGMECVRAQTAHINILAWHCLEFRDGDDGFRKIKGELDSGSSEARTGEVMKRCSWRQVPYPVVTACSCSCK